MELSTGTRQFNTFQSEVKAAGGIDDSSGIDTTDTDPPPPPTPGIGKDVKILVGKDMKWYYDQTTGNWYVAYKLPGSERYMVFEANGSEMDAIFGEGQRPTSYEPMSFGDITQQEGFTFGGNIMDVEGDGTFEGEVERVIALALDEGILPDWAQESDAVLDLLYIAHAEGKPTDWLIENLAMLPEFKARFPGIEAFEATGLNIIESVESFLELESGVKKLILADGGDPASVTPDMIGDLVAQGHSLTDVSTVFDIFDRLESHAGALEAFNEVLVANGMDPLDADDAFEFMAGNAPQEVYDLWEQSSLHQAAIESGLDIGVEGAIDLAKRTEGLTSYAGAMEGLTNAATNILRFRGEIGLDRFGLNEQDLIDLSLGLAPSSGASQADIGRNMERAFGAAKAKRDRARVNPFKRFTDEGVPQSASLSGLRSQSS